MTHPTDIQTIGTALYFLPVTNRIPLKFGREVVTGVTCARAWMRVRDRQGQVSEGWGETPLSATWVWPSTLSFQDRENALKLFSVQLAEAWAQFDVAGHPLEVGHAFQTDVLPGLWREFNSQRGESVEPMPWLAALVCCSAFDLALHDAFGRSVKRPVYHTYGGNFMSRDLAHFITPASDTRIDFRNKFPEDFMVEPKSTKLPVWHLVGGLDPLEPEEVDRTVSDDGYPATLAAWIERDGLNCLKIKLRGDDQPWDLDRILRVARIAAAHEVDWLTIDFNCMVLNPDYVNAILDELLTDHPRVYGKILYVEQPFPYELERHRIDVHSVAARKPLFMDESAHAWEQVALGRDLGWTGVALKTCKTQTGALLSACWAKAHGMQLMVQDLTNPMLAMIPHVQLAAHVGTIMGVESNAMQFYPDASLPEAQVHPGLFQRREGVLDLASISGSGFGYRLDEIKRRLPEAEIVCGDLAGRGGIPGNG